MVAKRQVMMRLPPPLLRRIAEHCAEHPRLNRTTLVEKAVTQWLDGYEGVRPEGAEGEAESEVVAPRAPSNIDRLIEAAARMAARLPE